MMKASDFKPGWIYVFEVEYAGIFEAEFLALLHGYAVWSRPFIFGADDPKMPRFVALGKILWAEPIALFTDQLSRLDYERILASKNDAPPASKS